MAGIDLSAPMKRNIPNRPNQDPNGGQPEKKMLPIEAKMGEYNEAGDMFKIKLSFFDFKNDADKVNQIAPDVFQVSIDKRRISWITIPTDKLSEFPNVLGKLKEVLTTSGNYIETSINNTIDKLGYLITETPTAEEKGAQEETIAKNWKELLSTLSDPETRKKFLKFQTTFICNTKYKESALSSKNAAIVLATNPMATFVTDKQTWFKDYNRTVNHGAPYVIINKVENIIDIEILNTLPMVQAAGGWNALVKKSGGASYGEAWTAIKESRKTALFYRKYGKSTTWAEKVYDVRDTQLISGKPDNFLEIAGLINNITGELNQPAKDEVEKERLEKGEEPVNLEEPKQGLSDDKELTAFKDFIFKLCKREKIQVFENDNIQDTIANAVYKYGYHVASEKYNLLRPEAQDSFAAALCYSIANAYNLQSSIVSKSINIFERLTDEEAGKMIRNSFEEFKKLSAFRMNEAMNKLDSISFDEYARALMDLRKGNKSKEMVAVKESFDKILDRINNVPR